MYHTTAAVIHQQNEPFHLEEVMLDEPRSHEIVVRLVAAGLCHTDISVQSGNVPFPMPGVLGHEGGGIVEAVGDAVSTVQPGDKVVLSYTSCGRCASCRGGRPALCDLWLPYNLLSGERPDGSAPLRAPGGGEVHGHFFGQSSYATLALADDRNAVRVDPDVPLEVLAPLGCGVQTGTGTVFNVLKPFPGASIAVVGAGAVGLSAVMAAALSPATTIIAADLVPERLALARELGATDIVDVNQVGVADALREITGGRGVDLALDTTGNVATIGATVSALAVGGRLAFVGAPPFGEAVPVDVNWMLPGRSVVGVTLGDADPRVAIPTLVRLFQQGRLPVDKLVKTYRFADIQAAADDFRRGRTIKPVLLFDD